MNYSTLSLSHTHTLNTTLPPLTRDLSLVTTPRIPVFGCTANAATPDSSTATPDQLG
jgi:hypothetical protein